jgi:hypothetical protein
MAGTDPITIVLAEDSAILRDGLVQLLTDRGFVVTRAVSDAISLEGGLIAGSRPCCSQWAARSARRPPRTGRQTCFLRLTSGTDASLPL